MDLQGRHLKAKKKNEQHTAAVRKNNDGREGTGEPHITMIIQDAGISFVFDEYTDSADSRKAPLIKRNPLAASSSGDKSDYTFTDSSIYSRAYYSRNHTS